MTITKQFVEMLGGIIEVQSVFNEESVFVVTLPFEIAPLPHHDNSVALQNDVSLEGSKVLLVEDNLLNQEIAQEILEDEGMEVTLAENGAIAVDTFKASPSGTFNYILMDIMMPVMNGLDATRTIRALDHPDAKSIPIIAMTANAFEEDIQKTREAGMNAHLSKPINIQLVLKVLKQYRQST